MNIGLSLFIILVTGVHIVAQETQENGKLPASTQWTLNAAGATQKAAIKSVLLLYCPVTKAKGTGFLLKNGVVVTNNHVVSGCSIQQLQGFTPSGQQIAFKKMVVDPEVDLACLRPAEVLAGGLELGADEDPELGTPVTTWGYPLIYNGPAPLLSVGYVAGYSADKSQNGTTVKHLVVNGAFNPGNSGGPLFTSRDGKVIAVVVANFHLYPPLVKTAIDVMANTKSGVQYGATNDQGAPISLSEAQIVAMVLDQFYKTTQVMIGEAISVSELRKFLKAHESDL